MKDTMLALRFQAKEMQALEEFWKPVVPVPQRNNKRMVHYCFFLSLFFFFACIYCDDLFGLKKRLTLICCKRKMLLFH
jgi:hypothetical protein